MSLISSVKRLVRDNFVEVVPAVDAEEASLESAAPPTPVSPADAARWFSETKEQDAPCAAVLATNGGIDFDRLFRNAAIDSGVHGAETVTRLLAEMPADIPPRVRRITVGAMLAHLSRTDPDAAEKIQTDASLKIVTVARFAASVEERAASIQAGTQREIGLLEERIEQLRREIETHGRLLAEIDRRRDTVQQSCRDRATELNAVLDVCQSPVKTTTVGAVPAATAGEADIRPELVFSRGQEGFRTPRLSPRLNGKLNGKIAASRTRKLALSGAGR